MATAADQINGALRLIGVLAEGEIIFRRGRRRNGVEYFPPVRNVKIHLNLRGGNLFPVHGVPQVDDHRGMPRPPLRVTGAIL